MNTKLNEIKVLKDPIWGYIHIEYKIIWDLIKTKEFQRLKRVKQLGGAFAVYHTAEHSRFGHSLGVYEVCVKMINNIPGLKDTLNEHEIILVYIAGLLHDLGHCPYSHAHETIFDTNHEVYSINIITKDSSINDVLNSYDINLAKEVASIINHTHTNTLLSQIISSELDADRMDYLLRDAYFTGTNYGVFEFERILRTLRVKDNRLVVKESGIKAIEDFLMSRYHMYWQVYFHPVARSYEIVLKQLYRRIKYLKETNQLDNLNVYDNCINNKYMTNIEHYYYDDNVCNYGILALTKHKDIIVNDLANRLLNRNLFKYLPDNNKNLNDINNILNLNGYDRDYYLYIDTIFKKAYQPYTKESEQNIYVLTDDNKIKEITEVSAIVLALSESKEKEVKKIYYPE